MAGEELRATLRGTEATLGVIRATDVARLIVGLESAVAAAAYATLAKPRRGSTGRHRAAIEAASRLRFERVEPGSVVAVLGLPDLSQGVDATLGIDVDDLAGAAFDRLVASFHQPDEQVDPGIARALADLSSSLGIGERHDELILASGRSTRESALNASSSERMRRLAAQPVDRQQDVLVGSLREADFDKRTARLRTATGEVVQVAFSAELEDAIQEALRARAQFEGVVTFDPVTALARRVDVRRITTPEPLPFDTSAFWSPRSVADWAEEQGVPVASFAEPLGDWTDDERRDLVEALAELDA